MFMGISQTWNLPFAACVGDKQAVTFGRGGDIYGQTQSARALSAPGPAGRRAELEV